MTTTVTINAHCAETKEVKITITEAGRPAETITLQDGETTDRYVYDDREISIREIAK